MAELNYTSTNPFSTSELSFDDFKTQVINDYRIVYESRQLSLMGRREVLTGKAKFGVFGDGKELAQVAMAKAFRKGDWRSGYYRDQTFMFATGMSTIREAFAQLYANPDLEKEPFSAGRQMNSHYATRSINADGTWKNLTEMMNSASDLSPTAIQMARVVGLAYASKLYRENPELADFSNFSINGNEIAFGTIGNASTSEGIFFEAINAAGVLQIPMVISVWDDEYGISVPNKYQTTKEDISEVLQGFQRTADKPGIEIFKVKGWDYVALCETYEQAAAISRNEHVPVLIHVTEVTQPLGHSTSGSHERYKSEERLAWEREYDCLPQMRSWMLSSAIATAEELDELEKETKSYVKGEMKAAWREFMNVAKKEKLEILNLLEQLGQELPEIARQALILSSEIDPLRKEMICTVRRCLRLARHHQSNAKQRVKEWLDKHLEINKERYNTYLFTDTPFSPLHVKKVEAQYSENSKMVDGREILNACFDFNFAKYKELVAFGEDLGKIGDVNQGFAGLQTKYGEIRISDVGIREMTIMGQGLGLSLRGLRPIAEIQYLDYIYFGINVLTDDLASLSYRTKGGQKTPMIIRTRGHRLEGIWHSGSPIGAILGSLRGIHFCVPRNMTQAAGMYNTLLKGDEPALVIECLNGYRIKEKMPDNIGDFTVLLGEVEVLKEGKDLTLVSYGSVLKQVMEAVEELSTLGIDVEVIDAQTLLPFDINMDCAKSLQKTNKLLIVDEDVPGGGSAYILQDILERQSGYYSLDAQPRTITAKDHRTPYGSDGDYFSKPNTDDIIEMAYLMMHEQNPSKFPKF